MLSTVFVVRWRKQVVVRPPPPPLELLELELELLLLDDDADSRLNTVVVAQSGAPVVCRHAEKRRQPASFCSFSTSRSTSSARGYSPSRARNPSK
jgi:hypothetical protein